MPVTSSLSITSKGVPFFLRSLALSLSRPFSTLLASSLFLLSRRSLSLSISCASITEESEFLRGLVDALGTGFLAPTGGGGPFRRRSVEFIGLLKMSRGSEGLELWDRGFDEEDIGGRGPPFPCCRGGGGFIRSMSLLGFRWAGGLGLAVTERLF